MSKSPLRVVFAGGGTGGHLFPALAVLDALRKRSSNVQASFVGTERGIEARVLPLRGERLKLIHAQPIRGKGLMERMRGGLAVPRALSESLTILREERPHVVVGVGGYSSFPVVMAARMLGIPSALMEQNAAVGLSNRALGPFVRKAFLTYPSTAAQFGKKAMVVGNPVREEILSLRGQTPFAKELASPTILVLGGSLGAQALNRSVPKVLAQIRSEIPFRVVHQTGPKMHAEVVALYAEAKVEAEVVAFIDDMKAVYSRSDLLISRSGATTLAEICIVGLPSVLVPFPFSAGDHQIKNAEAMVESGAARMVLEKDLEAKLASTLLPWLQSSEQRAQAAISARSLGRPEAADRIAQELMALALI